MDQTSPGKPGQPDYYNNLISIFSFNYMAAGPASFARNPGCRNRAGPAEIRYVIASAQYTGLKIANTRFLF